MAGGTIEAEVMPPLRKGARSSRGRIPDVFTPVTAGILLDILDLLTPGRLGLLAGFLVGGTAAYWIASKAGMKIRHRVLWALAAGLYCFIPRTELLPLGTLIGLLIRAYQHKETRSPS